MNLNDLDCPQFVNFDSSDFLCEEVSSLSIDAPDWSESAKKAKEVALEKGYKCKQKEYLESQFQNEESSPDKENQKSKINLKCNEDIKPVVGFKRKRTVPNIGEEKNKDLQHQTTSKLTNFNALKQLEPILPAQSPQLPVKKRCRLASAIEDKSTHKKLDVKTTRPASQALNPKATAPKIADKFGVKVPLLKKTENFQFKARPVPAYILKRSSCLKPDLKTQKPKSTKPPVQAKRGTETNPFKFDRLNKEKIQDKDNLKEVENEKKVFVFSADPKPKVGPSSSACVSSKPLSKPKVGPSTRPCVSSKPLLKPEPFRFGLEGSKIGSKECKTFKARPATVLRNKPFVPRPSPKLETKVQEFTLKTEQRAAERRLKQLAEKERFQKERMTFMDKISLDRVEILRKRREIFERYHIKLKPVERKHTTVTESESTNKN